MTPIEHAVCGAALSHLGFHRRYGIPITVVAMAASVLPDADSFGLLVDAPTYWKYHRGIVHSLGGIVLLSAAMVLACRMLVWLGEVGERRLGEGARLRAAAGAFGAREGNCLRLPALIFGVSMLAMAVHLATDAFYPWGMPLLWPLSGRLTWVPALDWPDPWVRLIMLTGMVAMILWRRRPRPAAAACLAALAVYVGTQVALHRPMP